MKGLGLFLERKYPYLLGLVAAGLYHVFLKDSLPPNPVELLGAAITLSSIAVGFLGAALAILLTIEDDSVLRQLREAGYYEGFVVYIARAVQLSFLSAIASAAGLFFNLSQVQCWYPAAFKAWIFVTVATAAALYRVVHLLAKVLRHRAARVASEHGS